MQRIYLILFIISSFRLSGNCEKDSTKVHLRFELQFQAGFYKSRCVNSPPWEFHDNGKQLLGVQVYPGLGLSVNWKWVSIGINASVMTRIEVEDKEQSTWGLSLLGNLDLNTWKTSTPIGLRFYGGVLPFGYLPVDNTGSSDVNTTPAYCLGLAPIFRLTKRFSPATLLLGPALEYDFGQYWNRQTMGGSSYSGRYSINYAFKYESFAVNIMFIIKFNNPEGHHRKADTERHQSPFPPVPFMPSKNRK